MNNQDEYVTGKVCEKCGYRNKKKNYERYGTCTRCGAIIDPKAKFEYEMVTKLKLWRKK